MTRTNGYYKVVALLMTMLLALSVVGVSDADAKKRKAKGDSVKGKFW